jgi:tetratricopeptide (TPR) repeat protein
LEKLRQSDSTSDLEDEIEFEAAEPVSAEAVIEEFSEEEAVEAPEPLSMVTGDATAKLSVARATLNAGELDDALEIYRDLLEEPAAVSEIIASLTDVLDQYQDQPAVYELLGDAQMRDGQLNRALDAYRAALEKM